MAESVQHCVWQLSGVHSGLSRGRCGCGTRPQRVAAIRHCICCLLVLFGISKSRRGKQKRTPTPAHNAEAPKANLPHRPAKKKKRIILLVAAVLAIAVVCALVYVKFGAAADAYELLKDFAEQPENAMTLSMSVQLDDTMVNTEMDITARLRFPMQ